MRVVLSDYNKEQMQEAVKRVEKMKKPDPKKTITSGILDFDELMLLLVELQKGLLTKYQQYIQDIFMASDLDGNHTLEFVEFDILYRVIEPAEYTFTKCCAVFSAYSDYINDQ